MRFLNWLPTLILCLLMVSCTDPNFYTQFSNQSSDEALYHNALKKIDAQEWQAAIDIIEGDLSSTYQQNVNVRESLMGAYAGKCGFSFITLVGGLSSASGGIFKVALGSFAGISVDTAACDSAVAILEGLGTSTQRTQNQNLYASLLGLARLGVSLHKTLDQESSGLGDGTVDAGFDVCLKPGVSTAGQLTDAEVKKVIVSVGLIFENIATLVAAMGSGNAGVDSIDAAKTQCEAALGAGNCSITDESNPALSGMLNMFRRMISSSSMGLGTCDLSVILPAPDCCPGLPL